MRVRNKELRRKWHRKEQRIKDLIKEAQAGGKKEKKPAKAEKPAAPKKAAAPKAESAEKPKKTTKKKEEAAPAE